MTNFEAWVTSKRARNAWTNEDDETVADEIESDVVSENAEVLPRKKLKMKTPQQPIDRKQVPKTPLKAKGYKNDEMNGRIRKKNAILNGFGQWFRDTSKKRNNAGFSKMPILDMCAENENSEIEGSNLMYQSTVVILNMIKNDEQALLSRAEKFIASIKPDPEYYDIESGRKIYFMAKMCSKQIHQMQNESIGGSRGKRKRKSYDNIDCYVSHYSRQMEGPDCPLPEGTKLTKPMTKLVELVAKAIFYSPNGMLQVKQVYIALQNRFPYFRFMHKTAINSWKSSIRHALYQKWFYKVKIVTGFHAESKGCYWALNTAYSPREWEMPGQRSQFETMTSSTSTSVDMTEKESDNQIDQTENESLNDTSTDEEITAIDLSMKRNNCMHKEIHEIPQKPRPGRTDSTIRKAKRRLDMSVGENDSIPRITTHGIVDELLGVAPLAPSPDMNGNYGIPLLPCTLGFFDENSVMFYPNANGSVDVLQQCAYPIERIRQSVWWDGNTEHDCIGVSAFQPVHYSHFKLV